MMSVGNVSVPAYLVANGYWGVKDITTIYNDQDVFQCPAGLIKFRDRWVAQQLQKGKKINDDPGLGLRRWRMKDTSKGESDFGVEFHFCDASYFNVALHEAKPESLEEANLLNQCCNEAFSGLQLGDATNSPLPNRPQLALSVLTADGLLVVTLRSSGLAVASGVFHASVVGGADPSKDVMPDIPILFAAMTREADEELGIIPEKITFRYFFLDEERNYQPGFAGFARTALTGAELLKLSPRDRKEGLRMLVKPDIDSVSKVIGASKMPAIEQLALLSAL